MIAAIKKTFALVMLITQSLVWLPSLAASQERDNKPSNQDKPLRLRADEVFVDAIVVDKKNKAVPNLTAEDFEVYEDGIKQKITSFRFESAERGSQTSPGAAITGGQPHQALRAPNLISLVFDAQTTRDGALRARRAALEYIDSGMGPNDYVAVFGIDLGLLVLSPYTNDKTAIRQAIEAFTSKESKKYLAVANEVRTQLESLVEPLSDAKKIALADSTFDMDVMFPEKLDEDVKGNGGGINTNELILAAINLTGLRVLRTFERYEREYQGWRTVTALLAIINGQRGARAGRRNVLLFSEGFAVSPAVQQQYLSIISAANTSGVTIYAFDIAGLRIINPNDQAALERDAANSARLRNPNPELVAGGVSTIGRMEENARINNLTTLDELTEETGGYTIKNTNDVTEGLKHILDELSNHYVMTYLPANQNYNGGFRRIQVKLARAGEYRVRARRGYYALRTFDQSPVLAYETPLLERANADSLVSDFPMHAQALHFRGTNAARLVALYVEFPVSALKFETEEKSKMFSSKFAILALVRNDSKEIVRKLGQEFTLKGPLAQMEDVRKKPQIYNRLILLPPGRYTLEAVARDTSSGKTSVARFPFEVPAQAENDLAISSIVLSRGVNPLTEEQKKQTQHPLYIEGQAYFLPNLPQVFSQSKDKNILLYFNAYANGAGAAKVSAKVTFLRDGNQFTEASGALPEPDQSGRISYVTSFALEHFPPGEYDVRVSVMDGARRSSSMAHFKVEP